MKFFTGVAAALITSSVAAQVTLPPSSDAGALQQRRLDEAQRRQDEERLQRSPLTDPVRQQPVKPAPELAQSTMRFTVRELSFVPTSEVFTADELTAWSLELQDREVVLADLQRLVERINQAYRARGIVTAQALIPAQDVTTGEIRIQLVEGRLGALKVSGNASTRESYISQRIDLQPTQLVDLPLLEQSLNRFNRGNDVQLRAELKPGQAFGSTDLFIEALEPPHHAWRFGVDNLGSETTGEIRTALSYSNASVLGWRDRLNLSALGSAGLSSYSLDYGFPVSHSGGRVNIGFNQDDTKLKYGPFADLGITGDARATTLSLRQPLHASQSHSLDFIGGVRQRESGNWISGVFLSNTQTDDANLGLEWQSSDAGGTWVASYSVYNGVSESAQVRSHYTLGRAAVQRNQVLSDGLTLRASMSLQHTSEAVLPSSEQFFIGGEGSVRGYASGTFSGDEGTAFSVELHHRLAPAGTQALGRLLTASGFFFVESARVQPFLPPDSILPKNESLTSLGWGLDAALGDSLNGRMTLAYGLRRLVPAQKRIKLNLQLSSQF